MPQRRFVNQFNHKQPIFILILNKSGYLGVLILTDTKNICPGCGTY